MMISNITNSPRPVRLVILIMMTGFILALLGTLFAQDWTSLQTPISASGGAMNGMHFLDKNTGWIVGNSTQGDIVRTTNGGVDWVVQPTPVSAYLNGVFFVDANTGYAVGSEDLFGNAAQVILKTTNSGQQWLRQTSPVSKGSLSDVRFVNATNGWAIGSDANSKQAVILHTADGATWVQSDHPVPQSNLNAITFADANHGWIVGGTSSYPYRPVILGTNNGGQTWVEQTQPLSEGSLLDVCFANSDSGWAVGKSNAGGIVLKTTDGGAHWSSAPAPSGSAASSVSLLSSTHAYLAMNAWQSSSWSLAVYETTNGGDTWTQFSTSIPDAYADKVQVVRGSIKVIVLSSQHVYVTSCSVSGIVWPPKAREGGCTVNPGVVPCECGSTEPITFTALPGDGWLFKSWNPAPPVTCPEDGNLDVVGIFEPFLTVDGVLRQQLCVSEVKGKTITIANFVAEASVADDWEIDGMIVVGFGDGDEAKDITNVRLRAEGTELGSQKYANDDGDITFTFAPILIPAGGSKSFSLEYAFSSDLEECTKKTFSLSANCIGMAKTAPPGRQIGNGVGSIEIGCVLNPAAEEVYGTIQEAINDGTTAPGHTLVVCPGTFEENVEVTKSLTIKSKNGKSETTVRAANAAGHTIKITQPNTTIDGFTILGATGQDLAGVFVSGLVTNAKIANNLLTGNWHGVNLSGAVKPIILKNVIENNTEDGIFSNAATGCEIVENIITKNQDCGIEMKNQTLIEARIAKNDIFENGNEGISLDACTHVLIEENVGIHNNRIDGIDITYCDSIKISNNKAVSENQFSGIEADGSKNIVIRGNQILDNKHYGVALINSWSNVIGGNRDNKEGNVISGNGVYGIWISELDSRDNKILGNFIGSDEEGMTKHTNKQHRGIQINADNNFVGSEQVGEGNTVSGNDCGIGVNFDNNQVIGNFIGTNKDGTAKIGNRVGIIILGSSNIIGGVSELARNIISGNTENGIDIQSAENNKIWGNYIGTDVSGESAIGNDKWGIKIIGGNNNIIGYHEGQGKGNLISGNREGVLIDYSQHNKIKGNLIGTNVDGTKELKRGACGIYIQNGNHNIIGGKTKEERNIISGHQKGIDLFMAEDNTIRGNYIGTDVTGSKAIGNGIGIEVSSSENFIGGEKSGEGNVISGNSTGISIQSVLAAATNNAILGNYIGTDATGNACLGNVSGVVLQRGAVDNYVGGYFIGQGNIISCNHIGVRLEYKAEKNWILQNRIGTGNNTSLMLGNDTGIDLNFSKENTVEQNMLWYNKKAILGIRDSTFVKTNSIKEGTGISTGIHLSGSKSVIIGNSITADAGDAITCDSSSTPAIYKNNIYDNNGYGLNNLDPTVTIDAQDNWWGNASGPGGAGSGSGDEVSSNVNFGNWRITPVALVVAAGADTVFVAKGAEDSVLCSFQNWENLNDVVNVSVTADSAGWLTSATNFSLAFEDSMGAGAMIHFAAPSAARLGAVNKVKITAISQSNPATTDADSFLVMVYNPVLARIVVSPDTALLQAGMTQQFIAQGYDSLGRAMETRLRWSCTCGAIDSTGFFTAGNDTGTCYVSAEDTVAHLAGTTIVSIFPLLARVEVSPDTAIIRPNATQQFTAQGYDSVATAIAVFTKWRATGGTITRAGLFTAGSDTGFYRVTAEDSLSRIAGSATVHITTATGVSKEDKPVLPTEFALEQSYPNPFNPVTTIKYSVKEQCHVLLRVYDILGREVITLVDSKHAPGFYRVSFDARNLASGIYFYRIRMKDFQAARKMVVLE